MMLITFSQVSRLLLHSKLSQNLVDLDNHHLDNRSFIPEFGLVLLGGSYASVLGPVSTAGCSLPSLGWPWQEELVCTLGHLILQQTSLGFLTLQLGSKRRRRGNVQGLSTLSSGLAQHHLYPAKLHRGGRRIMTTFSIHHKYLPSIQFKMA